MADARKTALEALLKVELSGAYSNLALNASIKRSGLDRRDTALTSALFYGVLERKLTLDYILNGYVKMPLQKMEPAVRCILRMGTFQLVFMDKIPDSAAVNESVRLARKRGLHAACGLVNGVLRNIARAPEKFVLPDPQKDKYKYLSIKYACPQEIIHLWTDAYGEETAVALLQSLYGRPPLVARVNTGLTNKAALVQALKEEGIDAQDVPFLQNGVTLTDTGAIEQGKAFAQGLFYIQDGASQLLCEMLAPKEEQTVVDVCAAPGGKSMNFALLMQDRGTVFAYDLYDHKCRLIAQTAKRLHLSSVHTSVRDAAANGGKSAIAADLVLCDVPCSGLGLLRRKPEIRYKNDLGLSTLPQLQYAILCNSAALVKRGGTLIYSTCTLNPAENGGISRRFLKAYHKTFVPLGLILPQGIQRGINEEKNELTLFPHINGTDGFFISAFKRV